MVSEPGGEETAMLVPYDETWTMEQARRQYFEVNGFGDDGGYSDAWVDFSLGPVKFPFPNTPARVKAVRYHDLHHVMTAYDTDTLGEFEISAWELGAGCGRFGAAWALNLGGLVAGLLVAPGRTAQAFVRGRRSRSLYAAEFEPLLGRSVGELRKTHLVEGDSGPQTPVKMTFADAVLLAAGALGGLVVGLLMLALVVPLLPFGLLAVAKARRAKLAAAR